MASRRQQAASPKRQAASSRPLAASSKQQGLSVVPLSDSSAPSIRSRAAPSSQSTNCAHSPCSSSEMRSSYRRSPRPPCTALARSNPRCSPKQGWRQSWALSRLSRACSRRGPGAAPRRWLSRACRRWRSSPARSAGNSPSALQSQAICVRIGPPIRRNGRLPRKQSVRTADDRR